MIDLHKKFKKEGYLIVDSAYDTTNILCRHGHIYADGKMLVAALEDPSIEPRALKKLGTVVMDGDDGEVSVKFALTMLPAVARILKPRYAALAG